MKNERLLQHIYTAMDCLDSKDIDGVRNVLDTLRVSTIDDIKIQNLPETSTKKQYNAIKKLFKAVPNSRPIFKVTHYEKGYQVFTDSYLLFRFYNDAIIRSLPNTEDHENRNLPNYPDTSQLVEPMIKNANLVANFKVSELKILIKTSNEYIDLSLDLTTMIRLGKKKLQLFIDIMCYKNDDIIKFNYVKTELDYSIRPLYAKYSDREAIIMPMRTV